MPAYKLDPEWVMSYLATQEEALVTDVPEQKEEIMNKIRELTLSIMYKQARRYIVYLESDETNTTNTTENLSHGKTRLS
ncbi:MULTISPECIES: hypothetical protein [Brevibacillus]|uniref:Uncharacterized protein n=1 Tax=Brevibacillus invocatus TaxID=173959 RepID=A0A3M8CM99_9BACL|nr:MULTISPECIES: hypothetical protein [Brevibacillus]MCM3079239.1 hypothetical protein [Brevibacillus invocatus]MCM3429218.1 hypothetical protein [Brevibacillus invocatus]MDH4615599.1 hypothetical protein [Brevibacillus sp. AY1]RNB76892.1 hypothetical protein EDM52_01485 [Brevibacillus invocatus]